MITFAPELHLRLQYSGADPDNSERRGWRNCGESEQPSLSKIDFSQNAAYNMHSGSIATKIEPPDAQYHPKHSSVVSMRKPGRR